MRKAVILAVLLASGPAWGQLSRVPFGDDRYSRESQERDQQIERQRRQIEELEARQRRQAEAERWREQQRRNRENQGTGTVHKWYR